MIEKIKNKQDFEITKEIKKIKFTIHSARAGCDWYGGIVKNGDYIVCYNTINNQAGGGGPLTVEECNKKFRTYESTKVFIDAAMKRYKEYQIKKEIEIKIEDELVVEQLSMFG